MRIKAFAIAALLALTAVTARAATMAIGQTNQQVNFGGIAQPVSISGTVPVSANGSTVAVTNVSGQNLNVAVAAALPAGANTIGSVNQAGAPWSQNLTQVGGASYSLGQKTMANSAPVVLASDQSAIPVSQSGAPWSQNVTQFGGSAVQTGTGASGAGIPRVTVSNDSNILATQSGTWSVGPIQLSTVNKSSQSVTTSSVQMFASNANRRGVELVSLCSNTDFVICNWSTSAALTDTIFLNPCSSWNPPPGEISTTALSCIGNSGTQVVRGTEYATP